MVHVDSRDVVVVVLVDHVDEIHSLGVEAKKTDPFFEVEMFLLDFFNKCGKDIFHLFLQNKQLRNFCIRILTDDVLQLRPLHFLALIMKQSTFTLRGEALLTDEGRFSAVGVNAYHETAIAVDTVWTIFNGFTHVRKKYIK